MGFFFIGQALATARASVRKLKMMERKAGYSARIQVAEDRYARMRR
jgi:hypothetical protein